LRRAASILSLAFVWLTSAPARADEMDVTLARLTVGDTTNPDDAAYGALMSQLAASLAPPSLAPARTLGARHFYIGVENALTHIDEDGVTPDGVPYWQLGTMGDSRSTRAAGNEFVHGLMNYTRLSFRKGLPFGIELGGSVGHAYATSTFLWGAEAKIALLEGYRHRWPAFLPDVALRGAVTTVTGNSQFNLTVPLAEVIVSKGIRVGADALLTPMVTAQMMWTVVRTGVVHVVSTGNTGADVVFADMNGRRMRMSAGAQLRFRMFTFAASARFDVADPSAHDPIVPDGVARQWNLDLGVGVTY
jgi:hypothetical protein